MSDPAHAATDDIIDKIESQIAKEYKKAHKEISEKMDDYLARFVTKDEKWQQWVADGKKTESEYKQWKQGQVFTGRRWAEMKETLATDYANAAQIAQSIAGKYAPEVYAINHNYSTFEVEKGSLVDTSYTLYSRESVERMYRENPKLYKQPGAKIKGEIAAGKQKKWDKRRIQSVITQGILQGESIPQFTKRLEAVTGGDHKAAIRNARTMMTGVENAGRIDAIKRAKDLGIPAKKQWLATLDSRTRHWHRMLDGVTKDVDAPFENEFGKILFPGDVSASGENIYNCRCTLITAIEGYEHDLSDTSLRHDERLGKMTYEEWQKEKKSTSNPITLPEEKAAAYKQMYINEYAGHGGAKSGGAHKHLPSEGKSIAVDYANEEMDLLKQNTYSGIWKGKTVTPADYADLKDSIQKKRDWYDKEIEKANTNGDTAKADKLKQMRDKLDEFEEKGKEYEKYKDIVDTYSATGGLPKKKPKSETTVETGTFGKDAYSDQREKDAKAFRSKEEADKYYRPLLDKEWDNLTEYQKYSVWKYTENSNPLNKSLSGYHDTWMRSGYVGVGEADWGHEDLWRKLQTKTFQKKFAKEGTSANIDHHKVITELTKAIDKQKLVDDAWLVRGSDENGLAGIFEGDLFSFDDALEILRSGSDSDIKTAFKGQRFTNHAFTSTGIAKGSGFSGSVTYEIYAPKGTHCIYAEPQSYFGDTIGMHEKIYKKGARYTSVGHEAEVILQRGTVFQVKDISKTGSDIKVVFEIVNQPDYFKTGMEETFNNGATMHLK